ncbi:hypothetical protein THAOC_19353 [Thalassiosira oceanica]|uniref:Uncharacterized protein n=1 Tax=Thalassiosira oceanica TaxID=159749 RepID=K0S4Y6_THAOC|nr:hypothetical protein THAOC_19353 [Thalassiosira oceanica]|eukprot:EJK60315.1 hypothetical protein THAOC_19353 [Thalassiosira oceanica]
MEIALRRLDDLGGRLHQLDQNALLADTSFPFGWMNVTSWPDAPFLMPPGNAKDNVALEMISRRVPAWKATLSDYNEDSRQNCRCNTHRWQTSGHSMMNLTPFTLTAMVRFSPDLLMATVRRAGRASIGIANKVFAFRPRRRCTILELKGEGCSLAPDLATCKAGRVDAMCDDDVACSVWAAAPPKPATRARAQHRASGRAD